MSYCRWAPDSDVYVYASDNGYVCCACEMVAEGNECRLRTRKEMVEHLLCHLGRGDKVPQDAIDRLQEESAAEAHRKEDE